VPPGSAAVVADGDPSFGLDMTPPPSSSSHSVGPG
jgi:hypothetical protein